MPTKKPIKIGLITLGLDRGRVHFRSGEWKKSFPADADKIAAYFGKHGLSLGHLICSSSCDFPEEAGFPKTFDIFTLMRQVAEKVARRGAIVIDPPLNPREAMESLEKIAKDRPFPFHILIRKISRKGDDAFVSFGDESSLNHFLNGMGYVVRVSEIAAKAKKKEAK